jgi:biotin carboxyl carrier protein
VAEIAITSLGNGTYQVIEGSRSRVAYAAGPADARWVFLDGHVYVIDVQGDSPDGLPAAVAQPFRAAKRKSDDHTALSAPMPATVLAITVEAGQRVTTGDVLLVLEAMKMELPIKSPRDATVKAVACRPGELVQPGIPLLELE